MNEIKVYEFDTDYPNDIQSGSYYDKNEADKVIAELEESHKMEVEQLLMEIAEMEEERRWRKFPDEKPEKRKVVFVRMSDGFYRIAMYLARGLGWDIGDGAHHKSKEVTHWMPLPKTLEDK